jgi:hypothetical protein
MSATSDRTAARKCYSTETENMTYALLGCTPQIPDERLKQILAGPDRAFTYEERRALLPHLQARCLELMEEDAEAEQGRKTKRSLTSTQLQKCIQRLERQQTRTPAEEAELVYIREELQERERSTGVSPTSASFRA